jgi:hypothetical protein
MTREMDWAVCPHDGEPLVTSLEVPQKEWLCMGCGARFAFFDSYDSAEPTDALRARHAELREQYVAGERPDVSVCPPVRDQADGEEQT